MLKFSNILNLLKKYSKLSDQQYKQIMSDKEKLDKLNEKGLLDSFYKARPDLSEDDIDEQLNLQKTIKQESIDMNPTVSEFLSFYGNAKIPQDILFRIGKIMLKTESFNRLKFKDFLDDLSDFSLKDLFELFYSKVKYSDDSLLKFIDLFLKIEDLEDERDQAERKNLIFTLEDENKLSELKDKLTKTLFVIIDQINKITKMDISVQDTVFKQMEEAKNLRDSDIFDFVFQPAKTEVA